MLKNPCVKDCPERSATCRLTCERGQAYFAQQHEVYEERQKTKIMSGDIAAYVRGEAEKNRKRHQRTRPRRRKKN